MKALNPFWRYRAGVPFSTLRPDERVKELDLPLLFIHGDRDQSVQPEHARILARGAGVEAVVMEGVGHNDILARTELHRQLSAFLEGIG